MASWKQRLRDMVLAGGALATAACGGTTQGGGSADVGGTADGGGGGLPDFFCGNGNPDPCICNRPERSASDKALCDQKKACEARGGEFWYGRDSVDFCMCGEGETDPTLIAECTQKKACEAQGGQFVWDAAAPPAMTCVFDENPGAAPPDDANH